MMVDSTALAPRPEIGTGTPVTAQVGAITFTRDQVELIKSTIARDQKLTDDELNLFLYAAGRQGLDPLAKQIYAIKRAGKMTLQTSIDGYRSIASRTGQYAGNDDPKFVWEDAEGGVHQLISATVAVYRMVGPHRCPFTATAYWEEYYPKARDPKAFTGMWDAMPRTMLAKCAEALALRKAFPAELSGTYVDAEMDQAGRADGNGARESVADEVVTKDTVISFGKHKGKTVEAAGIDYWEFLVSKIEPATAGKDYAVFAKAALNALTQPLGPAPQRDVTQRPAAFEPTDEDRALEERLAREGR